MKVPFRYSSKEARTVLDSLSARIAILDERGVILDANQAWRDFATKNSISEDHDFVGDSYLEICTKAKGEDSDNALTVAAGIRNVINEKVKEFLFDYPCHSPQSRHWYYMRVIKMSGEGEVRVVVSHEEITALKLTEEALRKSEERLTRQKLELEESNIALKVLLKQREADKFELEQKVIRNLKELVLPYVEKLNQLNLKPKYKTMVGIIESHLLDIISPMMQNITNANIILTPQEIQVASMVKDGKTSKEIANIFNVSEATIHFHRKNLRKKFGLKNSQTNLRSYLISIS